MRNREKRSKLNEDRDARVAGGASSSSGTEAAAVVSTSPSLVAAPSQRELWPRRARTDAQPMNVDESSGNNTEEDEAYLRDLRDGSDDETERYDMDEDEGDDDDGDSDDESEESAAGSSDLEDPLVTPAIQIPVRQAGVELVSYYNTGMTVATHLLRRQSPLDVPKDTVDYRFHTRF